MLNPIKNIYISGRRGRDHMVVGFETTCAISAYHHCLRYEIESRTWRDVFDTTCCVFFILKFSLMSDSSLRPSSSPTHSIMLWLPLFMI
jgi:hypothetical protein